MTDERRVTRREPIVVDVETTDGKEAIFSALPLPWRKRIDFGDALIQMFTNALNSLAHEVRNEAGEVVGIESRLFESVMDYSALYLLGYSTYTSDDKSGELKATPPVPKQVGLFNMLDFDPMYEVLEAALQVNGLERLAHMLDPDRKKGPTIGESEPPIEATIDGGEKTASAIDSGSLSEAGQERT